HDDVDPLFLLLGGRDQQGLQVGMLLPRPGEFVRVKDGEIKLLAVELVADIERAVLEEQFAIEAGRFLHDLLELAGREIDEDLRLVVDERLRHADLQGSGLCRGRCARGDKCKRRCEEGTNVSLSHESPHAGLMDRPLLVNMLTMMPTMRSASLMWYSFTSR